MFVYLKIIKSCNNVGRSVKPSFGPSVCLPAVYWLMMYCIFFCYWLYLSLSFTLSLCRLIQLCFFCAYISLLLFMYLICRYNLCVCLCVYLIVPSYNCCTKILIELHNNPIDTNYGDILLCCCLKEYKSLYVR